MMSHRKNFLSLPLILLAGLGTSPSQAADECLRHEFQHSPAWISTIALSNDGQRLLIADPKSKALWALDTGSKVRSPSIAAVEAPAGAGEHFSPLTVTASDVGFLVETSEGQTFALNQTASGSRPFHLTESSTGVPSGLGSFHSGWISHGEYVLGYGAVLGKGQDLASSSPLSVRRNYEVGFVLGKLDPAGWVKQVRLLRPFEGDLNVFYRLGLSYFAGNDAGLFFVQIAARETSLWEVVLRAGEAPALKPIDAVPDGYGAPGEFRPLPEGDAEAQLDSVARIYGQLESKKMVAGLFGQGQMLYLLTREPAGAEGTRWSLFEIDPRNPGSPQRHLILPTTANHLNLVPGSTSWYVVEKGPVRAWGDQGIGSYLEIPTRWIVDPSEESLNAESAEQVVCRAPR